MTSIKKRKNENIHESNFTKMCLIFDKSSLIEQEAQGPHC